MSHLLIAGLVPAIPPRHAGSCTPGTQEENPNKNKREKFDHRFEPFFTLPRPMGDRR
jgi:hypothetical protein